MSERLTITPLGPYIGAQVSGLDVTRPLSDNQFEQLYHAVLRHQVVFLREQAITPQQQRALAVRKGADSASKAAMPLAHSVSPPVSGSSFAERIAPAGGVSINVTSVCQLSLSLAGGGCETSAAAPSGRAHPSGNRQAGAVCE